MSVQTREKIGQDRGPSRRPESANLDRRYGKIGIPAVAAALRYAGEDRSARPSTAPRIDDRFIELAA